jgi:excisionase family DNA binding protein
MDELLTAKQVQELLKVDRTTIYRMLNDGRITGIKVGQQWRFHRREIEALVSGGSQEARRPPLSADVLPLQCLQPIQNVFAEIAQIGSVTTAPDGEPLTQLSNSCRFCNLILATESGRRGCTESWRRLAQQSEKPPKFGSCHAGLQYACSRVEVEGEFVAILVAGQFYSRPPRADEQAERVTRLARAHGIDGELLTVAARELKTLDEPRHAKIGSWLDSVAHTFEQIASERAQLMGRLERIAEMSTLGGGEAFAPR